MRIFTIMALAASCFIATTAQAETFDIIQQKKKFSEKKITIKAGDEINFINEDKTTHQIHDREGTFEPVVQKPGESHKVKFEEPGKYKLRCAIHPKMKLKVTVE